VPYIEVRLLPAPYVRAYVKRNKTDAADAEALLEVARCADIVPVRVKSLDEQALQALHRTRSRPDIRLQALPPCQTYRSASCSLGGSPYTGLGLPRMSAQPAMPSSMAGFLLSRCVATADFWSSPAFAKALLEQKGKGEVTAVGIARVLVIDVAPKDRFRCVPLDPPKRADVPPFARQFQPCVRCERKRESLLQNRDLRS